MFWTRLLSGAVLLLISFGCIYLGGIPLTALLLFLSVGAFYEMSRALGLMDKKHNILVIWGYVAITAFYALMCFTENYLYLVIAIVTGLIGFLVIYVFTYPKYEVEKISGAFFAFIYAPLMLSFIYFTRGLEHGSYLVWMIYISSWGQDTMAYCVGMITGRTIGNHKMTPKLSPKKSIEGAVGGILGAALLAWLYAKFIMGPNVNIEGLTITLPIIGAVGAFMAMIGDLAASAVKRNKGIKDYSQLIPGHGGILDRFDSVIFTAPFIYFLARIFINIF